jgi:hypothetical protein
MQSDKNGIVMRWGTDANQGIWPLPIIIAKSRVFVTITQPRPERQNGCFSTALLLFMTCLIADYFKLTYKACSL